MGYREGARPTRLRHAAEAMPEQAADDAVCVRFTELRFEGDRTIAGTAIEYGDVAKVYGSKERFETGAFAGVDSEDIILNMQHERAMPLARTIGGGMTVNESAQGVSLRAEIPSTQSGNDCLELVRTKVLRGLSIEYIPIDHRWEGDTFIVSKARLRGVAVVDRPAYKKSRIHPRYQQEAHRMSGDNPNQDGLDAKISASVESAVTKVLGERSDKTKFDPTEFAKSVSEGIGKSIGEQVRAEIAAADSKRAEAEADRAKMEKEKMEKEKMDKDKEKKMMEDAERRAELIVQCRPLLADDFVTKDRSAKDILVAAVGDEVKDADKRSEDYLEAKVEGILERRGDATRQAKGTGAGQAAGAGGKPPSGTPEGDGPAGGVNIIRLSERAMRDRHLRMQASL